MFSLLDLLVLPSVRQAGVFKVQVPCLALCLDVVLFEQQVGMRCKDPIQEKEVTTLHLFPRMGHKIRDSSEKKNPAALLGAISFPVRLTYIVHSPNEKIWSVVLWVPSVDTIEYIRSLYYTVKGLCVIDEVPDNNSWPLRESLRLVVLGDLVGCMVDEKTGAIVCMVALFFWFVVGCCVYCRFTS